MEHSSARWKVLLWTLSGWGEYCFHVLHFSTSPLTTEPVYKKRAPEDQLSLLWLLFGRSKHDNCVLWCTRSSQSLKTLGVRPAKLCSPESLGKEQPCRTMLVMLVLGTQRCSALPGWSLLWAGTGTTSSWGDQLVEIKDQGPINWVS